MRFVIALLAVSAIAFSALPARAAAPEVIGTFGSWTAYKYEDGGKPVCYMAARPDKMEPAGRKRSELLGAMVTHMPGDNTRNTFNYEAGYPYKTGSDVKVSVGDQTFTLFTEGERAWAPDQATDDSLAGAIQKGAQMVVKGTSARGTLTTDTFSLKGSGDAYAAISKACGVE